MKWHVFSLRRWSSHSLTSSTIDFSVWRPVFVKRKIFFNYTDLLANGSFLLAFIYFWIFNCFSICPYKMVTMPSFLVWFWDLTFAINIQRVYPLHWCFSQNSKVYFETHPCHLWPSLLGFWGKDFYFQKIFVVLGPNSFYSSVTGDNLSVP